MAIFIHLDIRPTPYDHPDAIKLNRQLQFEYVRRYGYWDGDKDVEPLETGMFNPPNGIYLVGYDDQERPVAGGGWCAHVKDDHGHFNGDAEVKRMYVIPEARGLGLARRVLAALEQSAWAAGRSRIILTTGTERPEAIALRDEVYRKFGVTAEAAQLFETSLGTALLILQGLKKGWHLLPKQYVQAQVLACA